MQCTFYNNTSDPRYISKSLTQISAANINLKDENNIVTPTITMSAQYVPNKANYCYIPTLKRYYYIRAMSIMPGKIAQLSLEVDPLMSFATEIKLLNVIADRSTSNGYRELVDNTVKTECRTKMYHYNLGNNSVFISGADNTGKQYILVTGG